VIVLASRSPQRRALLAALGVPFRVVVPAVDEGEDPLANARAKAAAVRARAPGPVAVLACDTEVVLDGRALGKPADADEARAMLRRLSGRTHEVRSAVVLSAGAGERERVVSTAVRVRAVGDELARWYVGTGEWRDRAGGYAIQGAGAVLVDGIDGDHTNVIGLPLGAVAELLAQAGLAPWSGPGTAG